MGHVLVVFRLGFPSLAFADETESCVFGFPQDCGGQRFSVGSDVDRSAVSDCLHQAGEGGRPSDSKVFAVKMLVSAVFEAGYV